MTPKLTDDEKRAPVAAAIDRLDADERGRCPTCRQPLPRRPPMREWPSHSGLSEAPARFENVVPFRPKGGAPRPR